MKKALVVDDDKFIRDQLEKLINELGHEIVIAKDGREALAAAKKGGISVLITDVYMENMDGDLLVEKVKEFDDKLPVIVMTGDESMDLERKLRSKDVLAYFVKPIEFKMMKKVLVSLMGKVETA